MGDEAKKELRREMRALRRDLGAEARAQADAAILAQVVASEAFAQARTVLAYLSFGDEVETRGIIRAAWEAGKTVALPTVVPGQRRMRWFRVESFDGLVKSSLGVEEPEPREDREWTGAEGEPALCLVPGLAFDAAGYRLGYGGGFYDVFLGAFDGVAMGLVRRAQRRDDLAALGVVDAHDVPVAFVADEDGITASTHAD